MNPGTKKKKKNFRHRGLRERMDSERGDEEKTCLRGPNRGGIGSKSRPGGTRGGAPGGKKIPAEEPG